jgi:hypothetical protein
MTKPVDTHVPAPAMRESARPVPRSVGERVWQSLGAEPAFAEAVLGDLAEEYAGRAARDGGLSAALWYAREALRSAPHLIANAIRYGSPRARARLALCFAGVALVVTGSFAALMLRNGPPARLAGVGDTGEGIVVNNMKPVQLEMQVLDAAGHVLEAKDSVRFAWASGAPIAVSPSGVVSCDRRGSATVRATYRTVTTNVNVRCYPVREIESSTWINFVAGEAARALPFEALGLDGERVTQLRGAVTVGDSDVAALTGAWVRPRAVGITAVTVEIGDYRTSMNVMVHELVSTFAGLRPDQQLVAQRVHLARGDTVSWVLPKGVFWVKYLPRNRSDAPPTITVHGPAGCNTGDGVHVFRLVVEEYSKYCLVHAEGATVTVAHGEHGPEIIDGFVALQRAGF